MTIKRTYTVAALLATIMLIIAILTSRRAYADQTEEQQVNETVHSDDPLVIIANAEVEGADVLVDMVWHPEFPLPTVAQTSIVNGRGESVRTVDVNPRPDELMQIIIPEALIDIEEHGLKYQVRVTDQANNELVNYPIHVMLDCDSEENCSYYLIAGFDSGGALLVTEELDQALDEVEAEQPDDILATVLDRYPHLLGDVMTLSLQLSYAENNVRDSSMSFQQKRARCACWWTAIVNRTPNSTGFSTASQPSSAFSAGFHGRGASHYMAAKSLGGQIVDGSNGSTELTMKMRCWGFTGWATKIIHIRITRWLTIRIRVRVPQFGWCASQCAGSVTQRANYAAELTARASGNSAWGYSMESVNYRVNGSTIFSEFGDAYAFAPFVPQDRNSINRSASRTMNEPSTAILQTEGFVGVFADDENNMGYAKVVNGYWMEAEASASCTIPNTVKSSWLLRFPYNPYLLVDRWTQYIDRFLP